MFKRQKQESVPDADHKQDAPVMPSNEDRGLFVNSVNKLIDKDKPSVISSACAIEGSVVSGGVLLLEGMINGSVNTETLTIGNDGRIHGQIDCKSLTIRGVFTGQAKCEDLYIASSASLEGDIDYQKIQVERGAVIIGELLHKKVE